MNDDTPQEQRDKKAVGKKIQRFRTQKGLSQIQLAERMEKNYTRKSVSTFENGSDHMRIGALFSLCDIFGVNLEELGPERLMSEENDFLKDYRSLTLEEREHLQSYLDYLRNKPKDGDEQPAEVQETPDGADNSPDERTEGDSAPESPGDADA